MCQKRRKSHDSHSRHLSPPEGVLVVTDMWVFGCIHLLPCNLDTHISDHYDIGFCCEVSFPQCQTAHHVGHKDMQIAYWIVKNMARKQLKVRGVIKQANYDFCIPYKGCTFFFTIWYTHTLYIQISNTVLFSWLSDTAAPSLPLIRILPPLCIKFNWCIREITETVELHI